MEKTEYSVGVMLSCFQRDYIYHTISREEYEKALSEIKELQESGVQIGTMTVTKEYDGYTVKSVFCEGKCGDVVYTRIVAQDGYEIP